jgi:hypothetical protein
MKRQIRIMLYSPSEVTPPLVDMQVLCGASCLDEHGTAGFEHSIAENGYRRSVEQACEAGDKCSASYR